MFKTLILICVIGVDPQACTPKTAIDVIPGQRASLQQCMFGGQALLAPTSIAPDAGRQFAKVICMPDRAETAAR